MSAETRPARWTEYMALESLLPNPANPKAHDNDLIDASIGRFGYVEPITLDERTGCLISGHGRRETLIAMRERGESVPEGVTVRDGDGAWLVPVARGWASRTDTEALAALVALNRTTEVGGWEEKALLDLLDQVTEMGGDDALLGVGYDEVAIAGLRSFLEGMDVIELFQSGSGESGEDDGSEGSGEPADEVLTLSPGTKELRVIVLEERFEEAHAALAEADWVVDVRDPSRGVK